MRTDSCVAAQALQTIRKEQSPKLTVSQFRWKILDSCWYNDTFIHSRNTSYRTFRARLRMVLVIGSLFAKVGTIYRFCSYYVRLLTSQG